MFEMVNQKVKKRWVSIGEKETLIELCSRCENKEFVMFIKEHPMQCFPVIYFQNFGWINCDKFLNETNVTNLACGFEPSDSISYAKVYLIFKSINSVIEERYTYDMGSTFNNVPVGMQGTVIAMAMKKGQLYSSRKEITINKGQKVTLTMKKSRDEDVAALMKF
jgi:hypothetical protein